MAEDIISAEARAALQEFHLPAGAGTKRRMAIGLTKAAGDAYPGYPTSGSGATVFPFVLVDDTFTEAAGVQEPGTIERSTQIRYCYNLAAPRWIREHSAIPVLRYCNRWWTYAGAGPCLLWSDNFNRSDAANPGAGWTVVSGTWPIISKRLRETTGSGVALVNCKFPLPQHPFVTLHAVATGKKYRLYAYWVSATLHYFAQAEWTDSNTVTVSLHYVNDTGEHMLESVEWTGVDFGTGGDYQFRVCLEGPAAVGGVGHFHARLGTSLLRGDAWIAANPDKTVLSQVGLGTDSTGAVEFDDFREETRLCAGMDCPDCFARCDDSHLAHVLWVAVCGSQRCAGYSADFEITWNYVNRRWENATPFTLCGISGYANAFFLKPVEETCLGPYTIWAFGRDGEEGGPPYILQDDSTCDPLYLHYRTTWTAVGPHLCCADGEEYGSPGQLDFYVTE